MQADSAAASENGKITLDAVRHAYHGIGDQHHVQARVISITQSTEMGTVYRPEEIQALPRFAHEHEMFLHVDGARIANAAATWVRRCASPRAISAWTCCRLAARKTESWVARRSCFSIAS